MTFEVTVKSWHGVASWTWDAGEALLEIGLEIFVNYAPQSVHPSATLPPAGDDVCGICRMPFDGCPPEAKYPGDDSPVVWGTCGHAFHLQCINRRVCTLVEDARTGHEGPKALN